MPLRKIDIPAKVVGRDSACLHPEHSPPMHIVLEPGTYHYDCPQCGAVTVFTVDPRARMG